VQFFILDGYTQTEVQRSWLEAGLATSAVPWQVVVVHFPPFSSAGSSSWMQWPYEAWGADAVFSGHAHVYERVMRDDNGDTTAIPYIVTGLGGADLRAFGTPVAGSAARYNAGHGTLVVEACDAGMSLAFHSVSHGVVDQYRIGASCPPRG
jgi:hypothetical protein